MGKATYLICLTALILGMGVAQASMAQNAPSADGANVDTLESPTENVEQPVDTTTFTPSEIQLLQDLKKRNVMLDRREKALELRERLVDLAEKRLSEKTKLMEILKGQLEKLLGNSSDKEEQELKDLAAIYEVMKPKAAAGVLDRMDNHIVFDIFKRMNRKSTAKIMENMDTGKARLISEMLAEKSLLPSFDD